MQKQASWRINAALLLLFHGARSDAWILCKSKMIAGKASCTHSLVGKVKLQELCDYEYLVCHGVFLKSKPCSTHYTVSAHSGVVCKYIYIYIHIYTHTHIYIYIYIYIIFIYIDISCISLHIIISHLKHEEAAMSAVRQVFGHVQTQRDRHGFVPTASAFVWCRCKLCDALSLCVARGRWPRDFPWLRLGLEWPIRPLGRAKVEVALALEKQASDSDSMTARLLVLVRFMWSLGVGEFWGSDLSWYCAKPQQPSL